ncbi:hypothetical protein SNN74_003370 [Cronobacter turicensis]|uniref:hypothetical protein n=1 Tax=Cronobacter turicensis TaxID=413502 RepID=UPI0024C41286|nr:hypothetical protein [Cronobacter turicensis]ELY5850609.1 hypothetical protein [Cronobacter turicensis]MDK1333863.1 hypothetical protein [Cronobacter turicensis]
MNNKKLERFIIQFVLSVVLGGLMASIFYGLYKQTGILVEVGSVVSKSLSVIGAVLVGLLVKRFVDYQDKIKDLDLNSKAPRSVVELFDSQKEDYFRLTYKTPVNFAYLVVAALMILACLITPLDEIKEKVGVGFFITVDTGLTVTTIVLLICLGYEVILRTEDARKAKAHFEKLKETESDRQALIETLNKKIREQRDADKKGTVKLRENKEFDMRGYLDSLRKDNPEE